MVWLHMQVIVPGNFTWRVKQSVHRADNLTNFMCPLSWNLGALTSWNTQGLSRPVMGLLYSSTPVNHVLRLQLWAFQYFAVLPAVVCQKILKYRPVLRFGQYRVVNFLQPFQCVCTVHPLYYHCSEYWGCSGMSQQMQGFCVIKLSCCLWQWKNDLCCMHKLVPAVCSRIWHGWSQKTSS
jgi:hypothetical protein